MARNGISLLLLCVLALSLGCSSENNDSKPAKGTKADKTAANPANAGITKTSERDLSPAEQVLTGIWLGSAYLDDKLVEAEFEAKPTDEEKAAFLDEAEIFLTTVVAIHFKPDGTFEQDIEQAASGLRQVGEGTWRVLSQKNDKLIVETTEKDSEGHVVTVERLFRLYPDQNGFAMPAPVADSMGPCGPLLVFSRQNPLVDQRTAESPAANEIR